MCSGFDLRYLSKLINEHLDYSFTKMVSSHPSNTRMTLNSYL